MLVAVSSFLSSPAAAHEDSSVVINGVPLSASDLGSIERQYQVRIPAGGYWYDSACGAWGLAGGPTLGFTMAGLALGGPLRVDASGGSAAGTLTAIFINGREIHPVDAVGLYQIVGPVYPGRYWVDAHGNAGMEGGPALVNLFQAARAAGGSSGYHRAGPGGYTGSDGSTYYFFDPETGSSVMGSN
jgi:hypothetical protein